MGDGYLGSYPLLPIDWSSLVFCLRDNRHLDNIYMSAAADFLAVMEKNLWQRVFPLSYISSKNLENFSEFFKFSENSADNAPAYALKGG